MPRLPRLRRLVFTAFCCAAALCCARPAAAFSHDPTLAWRTLSTAHCDINYYPGTAALATRTAAVCERRFGELAAYFKFQPQDRIQVVLADETDEANGGATPIPYNTIYLIVAPPDESLEVWDMDAWLDYVVSHEMTHIFHMDHDRGFPRWLRRYLGRAYWTFPNVYQPSWVLEGLAAWAETEPGRHVGRGQDPFYRGMMRLELQQGLKPVRTVNQPLVTWPAGTTRYVYGVYFMKYLEDSFGRESLRRWVENYSTNWIPYFINRNARKTFGVKLPALWDDFHDWLDQSLGAETRAIAAQGLKGGPAPVDWDGGNGWGPYKAGIAVRHDGLGRPMFQRLEGSHWKDLGEAYPSAFWAGPRRILYTEDEVNGWADYTRDLWQMDPHSGSSRRLTHGLRVQEAVETAAGVFALLGNQAQKRLVRLDQGQVAETLWQGTMDENVGSLCPSPDGQRLAASYWRQGLGWDVAEFDLATRAWILRASRPESEVQPSYSADGRTLYFSAAYAGVYNLYALDLGSAALSQVTNVVGGAFHPWPDGQGGLYFSMMTAQGMVLGQAPLEASAAALSGTGQASDLLGAASEGPVESPTQGKISGLSGAELAGPPAKGWLAKDLAPGLPAMKPLTPLALAESEPYAARNTLMPTSWFPALGVSSYGYFGGFQIGGDDLLDRHHFQALAYAGGGLSDVFGGLSYSYTRWLPQLGVMGQRSLSTEASGDGYRNRFDQMWEAALSVPWPGTWRSLALQAAVGADWHRDEGGDPGAPLLASQETTGGAVSLAYDSTAQPPRALGSVDGLQASVTYEMDNPGLGDDYAWLSGGLARPTRICGWLELEDSIGGGRVTRGDEVYTLSFKPMPGLQGGLLRFRPTYGLAGYQSGIAALSGFSYTQAELGLRFPIALVEWGIMAPPVGLDRVFGKVWGQSAQVYGLNNQGQGVFSTVGVELDADFILFYAADVELQLALARGLDAGGATTVTLNLVPLNFGVGGGGARVGRAANPLPNQ